MEVKDPENTRKCVKSSISQGYIKLKGEARELDMIVFEREGDCGHQFSQYSVTLRELLSQKESCVGEEYDTKS